MGRKEQSAYGVDIVNVVQTPVRVLRIVNDQRPTESLYSFH